MEHLYSAFMLQFLDSNVVAFDIALFDVALF